MNDPRAKVPSNRWLFSLNIGFFAGLIWGAVKMLEHYLHFTSLPPGFLVESFYKRSFLNSFQGYMVGWVTFIVFSILASLLYTALFSKSTGPWPGITYGAVWWVLIFLLIGPVTGMMNWIAFLDWNTIITEICLFIVWGLFIGYSISMEFNDEREREPFNTNNQEPQPE
ncbi:YqhR family membrane protein [Paenibacillus sp. RC67]|uniref:YqhR family membrane protein n=1 Tax=Paenibacillus sp. RC67 TaxID=3039392 RepID=UPI0024ACF688|nr:YqhR family membrane protein [Paenibacillus sp. RC67]